MRTIWAIILFNLSIIVVFITCSVSYAADVTLNWDASPSAAEYVCSIEEHESQTACETAGGVWASRVSGYKVYYAPSSLVHPLMGTGATEGDSPIDVGNVLTTTVTGLPADIPVCFALTAYNAEIESRFSHRVCTESFNKGVIYLGWGSGRRMDLAPSAAPPSNKSVLRFNAPQ